MLDTTVSPPSTLSDVHEARRRALRERLRLLLDQAADDLADDLAALPDDELFGAIEYRLRDRAHALATAALQAGLDDRKKGGTKVPPALAPTATKLPTSRGTSPAPS